MILLSTRTGLHVAFTLVAAPVIGAAFTMIAYAARPYDAGPSRTFTNVVVAPMSSLMSAWVWTASSRGLPWIHHLFP